MDLSAKGSPSAKSNWLQWPVWSGKTEAEVRAEAVAFGRELSARRVARGWTQRQLSEILGITIRLLGYWEYGQRPISDFHREALDLILRPAPSTNHAVNCTIGAMGLAPKNRRTKPAKKGSHVLLLTVRPEVKDHKPITKEKVRVEPPVQFTPLPPVPVPPKPVPTTSGLRPVVAKRPSGLSRRA